MNKECIATIARGEITLWEEPCFNYMMSISINKPSDDMEGDIGLTFYSNSIAIYYMTVSIIPGRILGIPDENVVFIGNVQGGAGRFDLIKQATKALDDVAPVILLFVSVQAIATAFGLSSIAGITARDQILVGDIDRRSRFYGCYDELWTKMRGRKLNDAVFLLPVVPEYIPMSGVKKNHRCRTKYKRQFKYLVFNHILRTFRQKCVKRAGEDVLLDENAVALLARSGS
jgi:uncharacterized protein VirK/YbjX